MVYCGFTSHSRAGVCPFLMSMAIAMVIFSVVMGRVQVVPGVYPEFLTSVRLVFLVLGVLAILGIYASYARGKIRGNNQVTDSG
jgi:hypothetical protein